MNKTNLHCLKHGRCSASTYLVLILGRLAPFSFALIFSLKKKSVLEIFLSIYFELGAHLNQVCNCLAPNLLDIVGGKGTWDQEPEVSQEYVGSINDNPKRRQTHF
jgi:CBS domain containing-hemolysin-like protein